MTSITISAERIAQVEAAIRKFVAGFLKPIDSLDEFLSSYHPDVEWYDHAFLIRRVGHQAVIGLQQGFTHCNQPFDVDIKVCRWFLSRDQPCINDPLQGYNPDRDRRDSRTSVDRPPLQ
jgi:hypothetical protein